MEQTISFADRKNRLLASKIVGIIRVDHTEYIIELVQALVDGGVSTLEISLNTPNALKAIKRVADHFGNKILLGVGTVTTVKQAKQSINAGAEFIVSPITDKKIQKYAKRFKTPTCMGALTPTEILTAFQMGSTLVKVFPAASLGPGYIKDITVPLPGIPLLPTGGVNKDNIEEWFKAGATALGISTALFRKEDYLEKRFDLITENARFLAQKAESATQS